MGCERVPDALGSGAIVSGFVYRFNPDQLKPDARAWYDRLTPLLDQPVARGRTNDDYARTVKERYAAILAAYLATGDAGLIERLVTLMDEAALHEMTVGVDLWESFVCATMALHALVLAQHGRNRDSIRWVNRIMERYKRIPQDNLAHPYAAGIESLHYLSMLGADGDYAARRNKAVEVFKRHVVTGDDGTVSWDQRMPITKSHAALGSPDFNYVRYTVSSVILLHEGGCTLIDPAVLARTIANKMCVGGKLAYNLIGDAGGKDGRTMNLDKWRTSNMALLARWNLDLRRFNEMAWRAGSLNIAAAQLWTGLG